MKILFIAPANSVHTVRWINALSEKENQVLLVSLPNHSEKKNTINSPVQVKYLPVSGMKGYYLNANALKKLAGNFQADVINVHYASGYGTLARMAHIPNVILSVWGSDVYEFPYRNKFNMRIIKKNLQYAKHIISTSIAMGKQIDKLYPVKKTLDILPFGVDILKFQPKLIECEKTTFVFCVVKALEPLYGIDVIIRAFSLFINKIEFYDKNIELHIYGEGSQKSQLRSLSTQLGCSDKVKWKGYIKNELLPTVLIYTDVFCVGSRKESFGVSTIEAMASGLPVIATETEGACEIVADNITGFLVHQESACEMSMCMERLYESAELRQTMGIAGRRRVEELYNWDKNVNSMILIYEKIKEVQK